MSQNSNVRLSNKTRTYLKYTATIGGIIGLSYILYKQFSNSNNNNNDNNNNKNTNEKQVRFSNITIPDEPITSNNNNNKNRKSPNSVRINSPINKFSVQKEILDNEFSLNPSRDLSITTKDSVEITMEFLNSPDNISVSGAGLDKVNGDYRYFAVPQAWTLFVEGYSLCIRGKVDVNEVYNELTRLQGPEKNFRWPSNITQCFVLCELEEQDVFYYAAPCLEINRVPKNGWISLNGSTPSPTLTAINHTVSQHRRRSLSQNSNKAQTPLTGINEDQQEDLYQEVLDKNVELEEDIQEDDGEDVEDGDISDLEN